MMDFFARIDPGWLIFVGVFMGALLLIEGMRQLTSRRETDGEARSRRMRLIAGGTQIEERLHILLPGDGSKIRSLGLILEICLWRLDCRNNQCCSDWARWRFFVWRRLP